MYNWVQWWKLLLDGKLLGVGVERGIFPPASLSPSPLLSILHTSFSPLHTSLHTHVCLASCHQNNLGYLYMMMMFWIDSNQLWFLCSQQNFQSINQVFVETCVILHCILCHYFGILFHTRDIKNIICSMIWITS